MITRRFSPHTAYVQPLCLPTPGDSLPAKAKAIGWGVINTDLDDANILLEVRLPLVDINTCNRTLWGLLDDNQVSVIFCVKFSVRLRIILPLLNKSYHFLTASSESRYIVGWADLELFSKMDLLLMPKVEYPIG